VKIADSNKQKKNYYDVAVGRTIGLFTTWSLCHKQVNGFNDACHRGFETLQECVYFLMQKVVFATEYNIKVYVNRSTKSLLDFCIEMDTESLANAPSVSSEQTDVKTTGVSSDDLLVVIILLPNSFV
jgi:viroplasmin and RNaseH domain-containing protein